MKKYLGVLGGGQLGKFFVEAAQRSGYNTVVMDPDSSAPAHKISNKSIVADYNDETALIELASICDAISLEFENVPWQCLHFLENLTTVFPNHQAVKITQNRILEKNFLTDLNIPIAEYVPIYNEQDLNKIKNFSGILKCATQSYDGKGQYRVSSYEQLSSAWNDTNRANCVFEKLLKLDLEISVILARTKDGNIVNLPLAENYHNNGILEITLAPARVREEHKNQAILYASMIAEKLNYVGVLAVEFFISEGKLLVNEIAPRPHNSGHFSIDACDISQFDLQVYCLCNEKIKTPQLSSSAVMLNVLGDAWNNKEPDWSNIIDRTNAVLHLYGKIPKPKRKMGHITLLNDKIETAKLYLQKIYKNT